MGKALCKEEQEAFNRWLTIEVRAAEILWHQKKAEAWFRAEYSYQDHTSEVTGSCEVGGSHREEGSAG